MTPERLQRIEDVYHAACGRVSASERDGFLAEACGADGELRREVESLLGLDGLEGILDRPAIELHEAALRDDATRPSTGSQLGPYLLEVPIGRGGMGEVWKARDPRLNREVAIKISAEQFTDRFEREAHAIAALNHSNICTLYDVGPNYLVMELVEGPTLADRIKRGPIPLEEALSVASQIAGAIEAAHGKGIIHRDLKPANIKIRPDGSLKVLDFGLAKAMNDQAGFASDSAPESSMIVGTPGYMAPEQARGEKVDKRADIWAFGVVLYEMVTGQRLFEGSSVSDTLAAVLTREPEWRRVPAKVQRLLRRCLEKDPTRRLRDISGVELLLEETRVPRGRGPIDMVWAAAATLFALSAAAIAFVHFREKPAETHLVRFKVGPPGNARLNSLVEGGLSPIVVSPDGRHLVFSATSVDGKNQLWVRSLDTFSAQPMAGTEDAINPFWSPDSRSIGFGAGGRLKKIGVNGGPAITLADATNLAGGTWNIGNVILFAPDLNEPIRRVAAAGSTSSPVTKLHGAKRETGHRWPWFLPDGRHFLFAAPVSLFGDLSDHVSICVGSVDSQDSKILFEADSNAVFAAGHLVFLRESTLMAQPFDLKRLAVAGDAVPIAREVQHNASSGTGLFSVSENGVLAYSAGEGGARRLTWFDRSGKRLSSVGDPGWPGVISFSPDRKRVAVAVTDHNDSDIWIYDLARDLRTRFTFLPGLELDAIWAPDGRTIVFNSNRKGEFDLYRKASNGNGPEELLYANDVSKYTEDWSRDGKFLLYSVVGPNTGPDIWVLPMTQEQVPAPLKPYPWLQTAFAEANSKFSPDGRWVSYQSNESGRFEIYVAPFRGPGGKQQVSKSGGRYPRWRRDGKEIFYVAPDKKLVAVEVNPQGATVEIGKTRPLFGPLVMGLGPLYDVSADGQRFLASVPLEQSTSQELTVVQNWTVGLKK